MEMALQPQSLLCPRSRPVLVIRPASSASGGGLMQYFLMTGRYTGSRIVRCMVSSSDRPNRKPKRSISLHMEVTSPSRYAPRITAESSIQEREHINSDEETFDTYNRLLHTEATEWKKLDTTEVDLSEDVSSSSMMKVDVVGEAKLDTLEDNLPGNLLSSVTIGEVDVVDEAGAEEDVFEVDLSALRNATVGKMDAVDETETENDLSEVDLSLLPSAAIGKVDVVDGAKAKEDLLEMDSLALHNVTMGKVNPVDATGAEGDIFEVDLSAVASNNSLIEAVNVMDKAKAIEDTLDVDLLGNATSSSTYGEVAAIDDAWLNEVKFEVDTLGNTSSTAMYGSVDGVYESWSDEVTFKVDSSENASINAAYGKTDLVDESWADDDTFEADFLRNASSGSEYGKVDVVDEAHTDDFTSEVVSLEDDSNNTMHGKVDMVYDAWDDEAIFEVDLFGNASSSAIYGEANVLDESRADDATPEVDLLGNASSNSTHEEVDVVEEAQTGEATFEVDLFGNALSSAIYKEVAVVGEAHDEVNVDLSRNASSTKTEKEADAVDEARVEDETFDMHLLGKRITIDSIDDDVVEEGTKHHKYPILSSKSVESKTTDETHVSLKPELVSVVKVQEQDKPILSVYRQEGSIFNLHSENQSMVDFHEQEQMVITFDKHKESVAKLSKEDQLIASFPEQNLSIDDFHRKNQPTIGLPFQLQSIVSSPEKDQSIVGFHGQNQSIISSHKQEKSIVGVPKKNQSIVGSTKHDHSIVSFHEQERSIVSVPEKKQAIIGFRKQDLSIVAVSEQNLSIVSISRESQSKQVPIVQRHGPLHLKEVETKARDYISQSISVAEEDDLPHMLFEEELSQVEDESRVIAYEKQHEADVISLSPDIQESPQDNIDPQELRRMLQELADQNCSMGNKLFVFPEAVKANLTIDLYLNRNLSALVNEPDVHMKGGFNRWRWRPFTERLHKSELGGDWWSCKLQIPKEAYRLDFVFFNGRLVYDNNDNNDFVLQVESKMDEDSFEKFLVEEKKRELERLATEEAERKRHAEEQQRMGEEMVAEQAARAQAKKEVELKKNKLRNMLSSARTYVDNFWHIEPSMYGQGDTVRLYYNRSSRPLTHSSEIWMHGGCNSWTDGLSIVERLVECDDKDGDWWYANVNIPEKAFVLDWVFADGPPGNARNYDNNGRQDFHAILPNVMTTEEFWVEEEHCIYRRLLQEFRERAEAVKRKAEKRANMKSEMKEKSMRMFLLSQKHIVYTEPLELRAGTTVDVLYNPSKTVLNGKPEVWFRWSFNRWMHGVSPPKKMVRAEDGCHLKATVSVPSDAYMMDFVFSESEEGGVYDNRNGTDYHIPVSGSNAMEPPIHIVHIAVEMAPIAKVGGLADVVTSLSRAIQELGHNVEVILLKYNFMNQSNVKNLHVRQSFSWGGTEIKVWFGLVEDLSVYFLEAQNGMFGVGSVYGGNDAGRFGFFCRSALEFLLQSGSSPYIIHCHDWSSAPVAWLYKEHYANSRLASAQIVFTIHNLEFGAHHIGKAMTYCDKATTVSHAYSKEVAGHRAIAPHRGKFYGILNGIDPDIWDPYTDNFIPVHYTSENVVEGKSAAKRALQQRLGLQQTDVPIVGIITRLTAQKGIHLIKHALHRTLERNGQVVLLGSAPDPRIQSDFCRLADSLHGENHGRVKLCLTYNEPLSHMIYAGSDFILVPSIFEPCGLTQLVAMRYGSIPIVRKTGGLYDTVFDVDHDKDRARVQGLEPNGFSFDGADSNGVDYALNRAITSWFEARGWFHSLCKRVMDQDWSWNRPALDYIELYHSAHKF